MAVVNREVITLFDLNQFIQSLDQKIFSGNPRLDEINKIREQALWFLVDQALAEKEAEKVGLKVPDAEVDQTIKNLMETNKFTDEQFQNMLKEEGFSSADYRKKVQKSILRTKLLGREVRPRVHIMDQQVEKYYQENIGEYQSKAWIHIKWIYLAKPAKAQAGELEKIQKTARDLRTQIQEGKSFEDLAKRYSQDSSAKEGGDLGRLDPAQLDQVLLNQIKNLKTGEVSAVLENEQAFLIIKVVDQEAGGVKKLAEVKEEIMELLFQKGMDVQIKTYLNSLREKAYIQIKL